MSTSLAASQAGSEPGPDRPPAGSEPAAQTPPAAEPWRLSLPDPGPELGLELGREAGSEAGPDPGGAAGAELGSPHGAEPDAGPDAEPAAGLAAGPDGGLAAGPDGGPDAEPAAGLAAGLAAEPDGGPDLEPDFAPAAAPRADELRIPPIVANLMPEEILQSRRTRKVKRRVISALVAFGLLLFGWYGVASYQTSVARTALQGADDGVQSLLHQQGRFADVVRARTESEATQARISMLLSQDVHWSRLTASVREAAPPGVKLTGVLCALTPIVAKSRSGSTGGRPAAGQLSHTPADKPIGTLTVSGSATTKEAVAAYVDALASAPGLANPLLGDVVLQEKALEFTVRLDITGAALGGRYSTKSSHGAAR